MALAVFFLDSPCILLKQENKPENLKPVDSFYFQKSTASDESTMEVHTSWHTFIINSIGNLNPAGFVVGTCLLSAVVTSLRHSSGTAPGQGLSHTVIKYLNRIIKS